MFPFWELAIAPVLEAIRRQDAIVEIGALRGETTVLMLERLGPDAELHVIDPVPEFDPDRARAAVPRPLHLPPGHQPQRARRACRRWTSRSIDGDHNWYTVYHELRMLADGAARRRATAAGADHARRAAGRTAGATSTTRRSGSPRSSASRTRSGACGRAGSSCCPGGGLNPTMYNAVDEGGPRNGVMTALDDFIAEYDRPLRRVVLPDLLRARDRRRGGAARASDRELARAPRLARERRGPARAARARRVDVRLRGDGLPAQRLLQPTSSSSNEPRDRYLDAAQGRAARRALPRERAADRVPRSSASSEAARARCQRRCATRRAHATRRSSERSGGARAGRRRRADDGERRPDYFPYTDDGPGPPRPPRALPRDDPHRGGRRRPRRVRHRARRRRDLPARLPRGPRAATTAGSGSPTASGPSPAIAVRARAFPRARSRPQADLNSVRDGFDRFDLLDDRVRFLQGAPTHTLADAPIEKVALAAHRCATCDGAIDDALDALYDRVAIGGFVVVDELRPTRPSGKRSRRSAPRRGIAEPIERVDWVGRSGARPSDGGRAAAPCERSRVGSLERAPARARRSAGVAQGPVGRRRLLQHAARGGAHAALAVARLPAGHRRPRLRGDRGRERVRRRRRSSARSSCAASVPSSATSTSAPTPRRRRRTRSTRHRAWPSGDALRADDRRRPRAHARRPALRHGRASPPTSPPIVVDPAVVRGSRPAGRRHADGYDQDYEDRLFDRDRVADRRLPPVRHRALHRRPRLVRRHVGEQLHLRPAQRCSSRSAASTRASRCRAAATPTSSSTSASVPRPTSRSSTILGEGSFHQVHGGTTTNEPDAERAPRSASPATPSTTRELRGRRLPRARQDRCTTSAACRRRRARTKARRRLAPNLFKAGIAADPDALPDEAAPDPRGARDRVRRRVLAEPRVARHDLARSAASASRRPTCSPTRS